MLNDLYPETEAEYDKLLTWALEAWLAARNAREPFEPRWDRYDLLYEAYIKRDKSDWRSRVFMPEVFQQIETIKPKLIANLPKFIVNPIGEEDVESAKVMERLIEWAAINSKLHLELAKTVHPTLLYGTGILKTFVDTQYAFGSEMVPVLQTETELVRKPLIDPETERQMRDVNGDLMFTEEEVSYQVPVGMRPQLKKYVAYDGPGAKAVDIKNFWPSAEAEDVQGARYVIHRSFKDRTEVEDLIAQGVYRLPHGKDVSYLSDAQGLLHDDPRILRLNALDRAPGNDPTRKQDELLEIWVKGSPGRVITIVNRACILRVHGNPYWHGQKPFIRLVDYMMPHRFWGIGEVQMMEGIQDAINAITNQRIDAGRLTIDPAYAVNESHLVSRSDLTRRPGQGIRIRGEGLDPRQVIQPLDMGGVPEHAFREVQELQRMGERTTAVSSYQQGIDAPAQADTATGASMMFEAGSSRFGLKAKMFEIDAFANIALHYGSILQQFTKEERKVRLLGPEGQTQFMSVDPASLQGGLDYTVESMNAQQSETVKRQQAMDVFNQVMQAASAGLIPPQLALPALKDVLETMGAKSVLKALDEQQQPMLPPAQ